MSPGESEVDYVDEDKMARQEMIEMLGEAERIRDRESRLTENQLARAYAAVKGGPMPPEIEAEEGEP